MRKKEEKKIYKMNKNLLKKMLIGITCIFIIVCIVFGAKIGKEILYPQFWKWHDINDYGFSIKLPKTYEELTASKDKLGISSSAFETETTIQVNEEYVSKKPVTVYNGWNPRNGVSMMVQCLNTEKTTKTLDEIAESNHILITIYYEDDYQIGELQKEYVKVLGCDAVRAMVDISNDDGTKTFVTYLVPMNDKEVTITFLGKKNNIDNSLDEIEKIVSLMK